MQNIFIAAVVYKNSNRKHLIMQGQEIIKLWSIHTMEQYLPTEIIIKIVACGKAFEISLKEKINM